MSPKNPSVDKEDEAGTGLIMSDTESWEGEKRKIR